ARYIAHGILCSFNCHSRKHIARHQSNTEVDQHGGKQRQVERARQHLADTAHEARLRVETDRNIGAYGARSRHKAIVIGCQTVGASDKPQSRSRVSRAATKASRHRHIFFKQKSSSLQPFYTFTYGSQGLDNQIVGNWPALASEGPRNLQAVSIDIT